MKLLHFIPAAALLLLCLPACKTTEENYRKAYEIAKTRSESGLTDEERSGFAREEAIPRTIFHGDSIALKSEYLTLKEGGKNGRQVRYNVIVASFKQLFNAKSVFTRLKDAGFADASLLIDRNQRYYVALQSTPSLAEAVATLHGLADGSVKPPLPVSSPYPYILQNPGLPAEEQPSAGTPG